VPARGEAQPRERLDRHHVGSDHAGDVADHQAVAAAAEPIGELSAKVRNVRSGDRGGDGEADRGTGHVGKTGRRR